MTEDEARAIAIKETEYCFVLATAWEGAENDSICLERIFTREHGEQEIRLAWWQNGNQAPRPADIDAVNWPGLFHTAIGQGVFTDSEKWSMLKSLLQ